MQDICLISLPKPHLKQPEAQANLGLMYIAAYARLFKKSVSIDDFATDTDDEAVQKLPKAIIYGISITSLEVLHANRFAKKIKERFNHARVILGGPGTLARDFIDFNYIDSIVLGDGELTILEVLRDAQNNMMQTIYEGKTVTDINTLPLPARDLLKGPQGGNIFAYNKKYSDSDSTIIISSRGCVHNCSFCSAKNLCNRRIRFRSPESVADEIRHVKNNYGITQFRFSDDMATASRKRTFELCNAIGPENVFWRISCRVKPLDDDMCKALIDAGCVELSFGIESFDQDVLNMLQKGTTVKDNVNALELAHKYGFSTRILMMIRTPGQTKQTVEKNKYWLKRVPFSIIACTGLIPLPGTDIFDKPDNYNIEILDKGLDKYNFYFYGPSGRRPLDKIFKIKDRDIDEFHQESEDFRDFIEDLGKVNRG